MIIEVFKTNVQTCDQAMWLTGIIQKLCASYKANFDLDDCDKILRIKNLTGKVNASEIIQMMNTAGFHAEVLEDDVTANHWQPLFAPMPSIHIKLFELN
jgi:hypothetical protein